MKWTCGKAAQQKVGEGIRGQHAKACTPDTEGQGETGTPDELNGRKAATETQTTSPQTGTTSAETWARHDARHIRQELQHEGDRAGGTL